MFHSLSGRTGRVLGLVVLTLFLVAGEVLAQTGRIEGTVRRTSTRDPLVGARVTVVGTSLAGVTNQNGYYSIENVPVGTYDVRVQIIGYQSVIATNQQVTANLPATVNFTLNASILRLEGVVVTGVAEATQAVKLPFTVDQVAAEDLPVPSRNAEEALRGKVSGIKIIKGSGRPGTGTTVLLRGATSINTSGRSNEPLYVVDGVILGAGDLRDVDALDIKNVEVVKGAAAAALYGARAANGVISITTMRGSELPEGETRITVRSEVGRNVLQRKIPVAQSHWFKLSADGSTYVDANGAPITKRADRVLDAIRDSVPDGLGGFEKWSYAISDNRYPGQTFDHLDQFFDPGTFYTNSVTVSHRTGATNFRASFSNTREGGVVDFVEGYERRGARVNVDHRIGTAFDFSASGYYSQSTDDDPSSGTNPFYGLNFYPIDIDLSELNPVNAADCRAELSGTCSARRDDKDFLINPDPQVVEENPLYAIANADEIRKRSRVLGSFRLRWRPVQEFDLSTDFSFDRSDRSRSEFLFKGFRTIDASSINNGRLTKSNTFSQSLNASATATWTKTLGDDLNVIAKGRLLMERSQEDFIQARAQDLVVDNVQDLDVGDAALSQVTGSSEEIRSLGYFLSTQFDYKDRYIIDALVRRDGSSLFGVDERWANYYRIGGAYRLSEESFWPDDGFIDEFKLRFSRGTAGGRPNFAAQYETFNVVSGSVGKGNLGNKDLKPEFATENEYGIDLIAAGRISLGVTYANTDVQDQLLLVPLAGYFGFSNQWRNAGRLKTNTWEATLQASVIQTRDINWNFNFVWDRTRQKITEFNLPAFRTGPGNAWYVRSNEVLGTMYGDRWATSCAEILTAGGFGAACDQFDMNDDGYLVPVGSGNVWTDGIDKQQYGRTIEIDGTSFTFGHPVRAKEVQTTVLPNGQSVTDTTEFLAIGGTQPDFNFGFGQTFRYKGFSVYTLFDAQIGGDIYNNTAQWPLRELNAQSVDQSGKPENEKKPITYYEALYNVNAVNSHFVEDGTYLKFRELSLRYSFDQDQLSGLFGGFMSRISLSLIGRNVHTWTGYSGYDPEVSTSGDAAIYRYDGFGYPNYRTWTGSVEIEF